LGCEAAKNKGQPCDKFLSESPLLSVITHIIHVIQKDNLFLLDISTVCNKDLIPQISYNMSITMAPPSTTKLELRTAYGPVFRDVLNTPPRDCTPEEIPVIDLTRLYSSAVSDRKDLAKEIRAAAVNTGFFYVKNHGIEEEIIGNAKKQLLAYVSRP
jgi:hypothetical protein